MATLTRPRLVPSAWKLDLSLSGSDNQDLRRLTRRFQHALTAIHDPHSPALVELVLPLAVQSPSVLHGLLALSRSCHSRSEVQLSRHQTTLRELVTEVVAAHSGTMDTARALRAMASSLLLSIFAISLSDNTWAHHVRGMISFARSTNRTQLVAEPVGCFLLGMCAFQDISAMSVGTEYLSQKAWLSWMTPEAGQTSISPFTTLEVTIGYPESLINIIAQAAEIADDHAYCRTSTLVATPGSNSASASGVWPAQSSWPSSELESALKRWNPPEFPEYMPIFQQLALRTAWEAIRKACLIFVWRGRGFHSNLTEPLPNSRAAESQILVGHILTDLKATLGLCKTQSLSIATAMMWPLAVVGCECATSPVKYREQTLSLLQDLANLYAMGQAKHLAGALERLWEQSVLNPSTSISLESVCREQQIVIPLV